MSKIMDFNEHLKKAKVYVESPTDAPEGAAIKTGSKGGHYYEAGPKTEKPVEEKPQQQKTVLSDEEISTLIKDLTSGYPHGPGKRLKKIADELYTKKGMSPEDVHVLNTFYSGEKETEGHWISNETLFSQLYWADKMGMDSKDVHRKIKNKFSDDAGNAIDAKGVSQYIEKTYHGRTMEEISQYLDNSREVIKELFDSKKITVYRGCSPDKLPADAKDSVKFDSIFPVTRWTLDPDIAIRFARGKKGKVVKAEITADRILEMDFVTGNTPLSEELEVNIDHRWIEGKIYDVYNEPETMKELMEYREKVAEIIPVKKSISIIDITDDHNWISDIRKKAIKKSSDNSLKAQIDFASKLTGINHFIITGLDDSFSKDAEEKLASYAKDNNIQIGIELATDGMELVVDRSKLLKDIKKAEDNIFGIFTPPKISMAFFEDNFNAKDLWDRWGRDKLSRGSKISVEPKYDGFRAVLTKKEGIIRLWLIESQQERAIILGEAIEKLLTIPFDFAIDGVLETDISILNDDYQTDGKTFEYTMFDAPYIASDNTDYSYEYRREKLKELFKTHFAGLKNFALGRSEIVENRDLFFSAVEKLLGSGKSVIVKDIAGRYTFGETDNVNRARKKAEIKVIVLDKEMDADGKWIYTCGVLS